MAGECDLFHAMNGATSSPALDAVALALDVSALLYVIVLWAAPLWLARRRALAFDFILALLVTVAVTEIIKFAVLRDRPVTACIDAPVYLLKPALFPDVSDPSFPSGHTSRAFVFAALLGLHRRRWLLGLLPYATLVGLARVYEGAHFPSDILGGAVTGIAFGVLFWKLDAVPRYVRFRERLIGRWLSPGPGAHGGSTSPPGPGPS